MSKEYYPTGLIMKYYSQGLQVEVHWSCCSPNPKPPILSSIQYLQGWSHKKNCSAKYCNIFIKMLLDSRKHLKLARNWNTHCNQVTSNCLHGLYMNKVRDLRHQTSSKTEVFQIPERQNNFSRLRTSQAQYKTTGRMLLSNQQYEHYLFNLKGHDSSKFANSNINWLRIDRLIQDQGTFQL